MVNKRYYNPTTRINQHPELEAAQEQGLARLFGEYVAESQVESFAQVRVPPTEGFKLDSVQGSEPTTVGTVAADVELMRLAVGLKQARQAQLWLMLLDRVRATGKNYVLKRDLAALVQSYGIECSDRNLSRWVNKGHGLYWHVTPDRLWFIGYKSLATRLVQYAREKGLYDLINTNQPGQRRFMYIAVGSQRLVEFEASVYAAWLASRKNPTIARSTLTALFNRDVRALREWESVAGIEIIENFAHYTSDHTDAIPQDRDGLRGDVHEYDRAGETRWKAQLSNTYRVPAAIKEHPKRGQSRKVWRAVLDVLESDNPAGNCGQISVGTTGANGGLKRSGKQYFSNHDRAKQSAKHAGLKPRFVLIASDKKCTRQQWEFTPDGKQFVGRNEVLNA